MCFRIEVEVEKKVIEHNAFSHPLLNSITASGEEGQFYWGLVPHWAKNDEQIQSIRKKTLNARVETVAEKPSFRYAFKHGRALVPVTAFFEWRHQGKDKIKHRIHHAEHEYFYLAAITATCGELKTLSIVTMQANELMATIHNTKQRMPMMLTSNTANAWLEQAKSDAIDSDFLVAEIC